MGDGGPSQCSWMENSAHNGPIRSRRRSFSVPDAPNDDLLHSAVGNNRVVRRMLPLHFSHLAYHLSLEQTGGSVVFVLAR